MNAKFHGDRGYYSRHEEPGGTVDVLVIVVKLAALVGGTAAVIAFCTWAVS